MSVLRGEVYSIGRVKVAVLSGDRVNTLGRPWCSPIYRQAPVSPDLAPFVVPAHETDPVAGALLLLEARAVPVEAFADPPVGTLVGATLARVDDGLRELFDLP